MKRKFWKHTYTLSIFCPVMISISLALIILGIILAITTNFAFIGMIIGGLIPLLFVLFYLVFDKRLLSKVVFSENGIELTRFKKQIVSVSWDDITEVKSTPISWSSSYLTFLSKENQIDIELTQKIYNTIMFVCQNPTIKMKINEIDKFKNFHKTI